MCTLSVRKKLAIIIIIAFVLPEAVAAPQQYAVPALRAQDPAMVSVSATIPLANSAKSPGQESKPAVDQNPGEATSKRNTEKTAGETRPLEDFNSLAIPAGLDFETLALEKGDFPEYSKELVRGEWRAGDTVDFWIIRPEGVKKPPVILYLYSYPSTLDRYKNPEVCKFLTRNGFAAVGFVSALTSDRFVARPMKQWFISELQESLATTAHDVQFILNYLARRGDFDMARMGMFGDGSGASIAILAASADPRIKVLDLLDPWGDWPEWLAKSSLVPENERDDYLKPEFLKKVESLDPMNVLPTLNSRRVRLQHIQDLKVTPPVVRARLEAAAPANVKIVHYQSTKAFMSDVASSGKGFDWIKEQLESLFSADSPSITNVGPVSEVTK